MHDAVLGPHQLEFVAGAGLGFEQYFMDGGGGEFERCQAAIAQQQARQEQP
ncbi:hypothetical protein D3C84_654130 [compost metagenome]